MTSSGRSEPPNPERFRRIAELFDGAIDLPPADRARYLARECGDQPELMAEILRLLAIEEGTGQGEFIEQAVRTAVRDVAGPDDRTGSGRFAGPYRLVRELGRGGMGSVWLAERADAEYTARVAVKLVPLGPFTDDLVRRFRSERQILASLAHPNIARLLDGGTTDAGVPYLVMEYVDGEPVTRFADRAGLPISARLELFLEICAAVAHAHRNLIVHRDIKPGNILVTADGTPKLLDFGIAKLVPPVEEDARVDTAPTGRLMTPTYASPEQVTGAPITTATDVYALGLLLYELLTGRRAQRTAGSTPAEIERSIRTELPVRPSAALRDTPPDAHEDPAAVAAARDTRPDRLERDLRGDLDTIVMMALRKEPERRYRSVDELAADVRRHLEGRPVAARPDTWGYRAERFVRRHRVGVAVAAGAVVVLIGLVAAMLVQAARLARERAQAREVASFLVDVFREADPWEAPRSDLTARDIVARGVRRVDAELAGQPAVQATLLTALSRIYQRLAEPDSGLALIDRAVELRRRLDPGGTDLAESLVARGSLLLDVGRGSESIRTFEEALRLQRDAWGDANPAVAATLGELGGSLAAVGRFDDAAATLREAWQLDRRLLGSHDRRTLRSQVVYAGMLHYLSRQDEALGLLRAALAEQRAILGPDHPEIAETLNALGAVLDSLGRLPEAEAALRESIAMGGRVLGPNHPEVMTMRGNLANLYSEHGQPARADSIYRDLIDRRRAAGLDFAVQANNYAPLLAELGRSEEGERLVEEGIADLEKRLDGPNTTYTYLFNTLGVLRRKRGDLAGSEAAFREAVERTRQSYGPDHAMTAYVIRQLGNVLRRRGRLAEAERLLTEALAIRTRALPADNADRVESLMDLAAVLQDRRQFQRADSLLRQAERAVGAAAKPDTARLASIRQRVADLHRSWGWPEPESKPRGR